MTVIHLLEIKLKVGRTDNGERDSEEEKVKETVREKHETGSEGEEVKNGSKSAGICIDNMDQNNVSFVTSTFKL